MWTFLKSPKVTFCHEILKTEHLVIKFWKITTFGNMNITRKVWYQHVVLLQIYYKKLTFYIFLLLYSKILDYLRNYFWNYLQWHFMHDCFEKSQWLTTIYTKKSMFLNTAWKMWMALDNNKIIFRFSDFWFKNRSTKTYICP